MVVDFRPSRRPTLGVEWELGLVDACTGDLVSAAAEVVEEARTGISAGESRVHRELLRNTGELIQFSHLTDPDTGGLGRYGRIASVALNGPWSASVQIDSTVDNLQALLNRFQANASQVR